MFRMATFLVVLAGEARRERAAVRVSHARMVRRRDDDGGAAFDECLGDKGPSTRFGGCWALGETIRSAASMPRRALGWADRSEGMTLLMMALAFFARASRRKAGGGRPMEGSVLPMMALLLCVWSEVTIGMSFIWVCGKVEREGSDQISMRSL